MAVGAFCGRLGGDAIAMSMRKTVGALTAVLSARFRRNSGRKSSPRMCLAFQVRLPRGVDDPRDCERRDPSYAGDARCVRAHLRTAPRRPRAPPRALRPTLRLAATETGRVYSTLDLVRASAPLLRTVIDESGAG
jgi:hypothetical protein